MNSADQGGLLTCLSPLGDGSVKDDRSLHRHFALSSALRSSDNPKQLSTSQYLSCIMEGMGPRFRPEQSSATILQQDLVRQLTQGGYGAGSYWKHLWKNDGAPPSDPHPPVLAVLGNTSRRHGHVHQVATELQEALQSSKLRGFYSRDVAQGALPEADDCQEALVACWDLTDAYLPPSGSGLGGGHTMDGGYYDTS